jgi:hypothetical protein
MESCHHSAAGQQLVDYQGRLTAGSAVSAPPFTVPAGRHHLTVTATAPGSTFGLELADASGRVISNAAATGSGTPGLAVAVVSNPPAGPVSARLTGQQVDAASPAFFLSASTDGQTTTRHVTPLQAGANTSGPLGRQRMQIRQALTAAALVTGICFVLISIRGLARRMQLRRTGRKKGGFLVPLVLYPGAIFGLIALVCAVGLNILWEMPLIPLPSF